MRLKYDRHFILNYINKPMENKPLTAEEFFKENEFDFLSYVDKEEIQHFLPCIYSAMEEYKEHHLKQFAEECGNNLPFPYTVKRLLTDYLNKL